MATTPDYTWLANLLQVSLGSGLVTPQLLVEAALGVVPPTPVNVVTAGLQTSFTLTNPPTSGDANNAYALSFTTIVDHALLNPNFSNTQGLEFNFYYPCGRNHFDASAKTTAVQFGMDYEASGAGQRIPINWTVNAPGMGDLIPLNLYITCGGGADANGDQGQYLANFVFQQPSSLARTTITYSYTSMQGQSATLSQAVAKSSGFPFPQTVPVSSTLYMRDGDYLTVNLQPPGGSSHDGASEANMDVWGPITVIDSAHISVPVVNVAQSQGATIQGATRLAVSNPAGFGQHRILVNRSQTAYTQGSAAVTSGNTVTGSGTGWTSLGTGPYAISFVADNNTQGPFSVGTPLESYYFVMQVASDTQLTLLHRSFQLVAYTGLATSQGGYYIRPAARVWYIGDPGSPIKNSNVVILPCSTNAWSVGDTVECCISPELYFQGISITGAVYTPGTTLGAVLNFSNSGTQPLGGLFSCQDAANDYSVARFGTVGTILGATLGLQFGHMFGPCLDFADSATAGYWSSSPYKPGWYYNQSTGLVELFLGGPAAYQKPVAGVTVAQQGLFWVSKPSVSGSQAEYSLAAGLVQTIDGVTGAANQAYHAFKYVHGSSSLLVTETLGSLQTVGWTWQGQSYTLLRPFFTGTLRAAAIKTITHADSPYQVSQFTDRTLLADASGGAITITLPPATTYYGTKQAQPVTVKKIDSSANTVTINRNGADGDTLEGGTSYTLSAQYKYVALECAATADTSAGAWWIVSNN